MTEAAEQASYWDVWLLLLVLVPWLGGVIYLVLTGTSGRGFQNLHKAWGPFFYGTGCLLGLLWIISTGNPVRTPPGGWTAYEVLYWVTGAIAMPILFWYFGWVYRKVSLGRWRHGMVGQLNAPDTERKNHGDSPSQ